MQGVRAKFEDFHSPFCPKNLLVIARFRALYDTQRWLSQFMAILTALFRHACSMNSSPQTMPPRRHHVKKRGTLHLHEIKGR